MLVSIFILFLGLLALICEANALESNYEFFNGIGFGFSVDNAVTEKGLNCKDIQVVVLCFYANYIIEL